MQFVKMGQHQSPAVDLLVGVPQGSVWDLCCSLPILQSDCRRHSESQCALHQYADDTQLYFVVRADKTADKLSVLSAYTADVRQWYLQNGLQLKLRQLRSIRRSVPTDALHTLVHAFISSHIDYCNAVLYGATDADIRRLQAVLHAAARLITVVR